jgi:elongation factor Ts
MNCETDFVAKNDDFIKLANQIIDAAVEKQPNNIDELKQLQIEGKTVEETINYYTGIIGEKLELAYYDYIEAAKVTSYIHMDNKLAALVGLNKDNVDQDVAKNVAMQVAAMDPVAVDKDSVPQDVVDKEYEIGKKQAQSEGKPENILDKIAKGKVEKFMKENTLLNQEFIRDSKKSVRQYLQEQD